MKTKILSMLAASCLLVAAAWFVHVPNTAQADDVPEKYRETVRKGLEYLVAHQFEDGHWEGDGGKHPVATTALAAIALLMEGKASEGKHAANIRKAADWLMSKSQPGRDGLIFSGHSSETYHYMDGHGLATQFLAWSLYDETTIPKEAEVVRLEKQLELVNRAVAYIVKSQSTQGGWYRTSKVEGHDFAEISTTAIQLQALQIVGAKVGIPNNSIKKDAQEYLKSEVEKLKEGAKPEPNPRRAAKLAAALVCRENSRIQDELCTTWFKRCRTEIPMGQDVKFGRDELTHYWYALALYDQTLHLSSDADASWSDYRTTMFDHLQSSQSKDGSWSAAPEAEGISVGPVFSTAVWCAVLQFDKKRHPLTQQRMFATR